MYTTNVNIQIHFCCAVCNFVVVKLCYIHRLHMQHSSDVSSTARLIDLRVWWGEPNNKFERIW